MIRELKPSAPIRQTVTMKCRCCKLESADTFYFAHGMCYDCRIVLTTELAIQENLAESVTVLNKAGYSLADIAKILNRPIGRIRGFLKKEK